MDLGLALVFMLMSFAPVPDQNGMIIRQAWGLCTLLSIVAYKLSEKFSLILGLFFFYICVNSFSNSDSSNIMTPLLFSALALIFKRHDVERILPVLAWVAIGDSAFMIIRFIFSLDYTHSWWVVTNPSLDACFIALMMPVVEKWEKGTLWLGAMGTAIVISRSNTGMAAVLVIALALLISKKVKQPLYYLGLGIFGAVCAGYMMFFHKFLENSGRFYSWGNMMTWWKENANVFFGTGPGTFWKYAEVIQPQVQKLPWMHNDWLQEIFTQGLVGFVLMVILYILMLKKSFYRPMLFSMVVGYGFIGLTQFPNHLIHFQILGCSLIYLCLEKPKGTICQMP